MTTGNFWDVTNPKKPFGEFDPDGVYDIPFDWATWLAGIGAAYDSHVIECDENLEVVASSENGGVITVRIQAAADGELVEGQKYHITCHIISDDGQEEDQTLYLKVREK